MEMYMSELDELKMTASGSLWGLWSHSEKAVVHLAVPDNAKRGLLEHCQSQKLSKVGEYNSKWPCSVKRPAGLNPTLTYLFLLRDDSGQLEIFHVDECGDTHDVPEVNYLPKLSPYRYVSDPNSYTDKSNQIKQKYEKKEKPEGLPPTLWVSMPEYSRFLNELGVSITKLGFEVKHILQPGSAYLAFFAENKKTQKSCAIGFPETFASDRKVTVKVGSSPKAEETELPTDLEKAKDHLLSIFRKSIKAQENDGNSQKEAKTGPGASEEELSKPKKSHDKNQKESSSPTSKNKFVAEGSEEALAKKEEEKTQKS